MTTSETSVFNYLDFRAFLKDFLDSRVRKKGCSYRLFVKRCGFSSPNYFQRLIGERRKLSMKNAERIVKGLNLDASEGSYFMLLVEIENERNQAKRDKLIRKAQRQSRISDTKMIVDQSIRCHWLIGVIWELAGCKGVELSFKSIQKKFGHIASSRDIEFCLEFLVESGYLEEHGGKTYRKAVNVNFSGVNDKKNFDVRKSHLRFLELAKLRLHDGLDEREYQGLNIAIPMSRFQDVKKKMRQLIEEINTELSEEEDADTVIRVQLAAFKVSA